MEKRIRLLAGGGKDQIRAGRCRIANGRFS
uniref:Uncharacterized protein n=1 Tax=Arundo donax TaxID=35708 RepID=A0A0A8ZV39_ARUDO